MGKEYPQLVCVCVGESVCQCDELSVNHSTVNYFVTLLGVSLCREL